MDSLKFTIYTVHFTIPSVHRPIATAAVSAVIIDWTIEETVVLVETLLSQWSSVVNSHLCSVLCAGYRRQCAKHSVQCVVCRAQCALFSLQCAMSIVKCAVCSV